MLSTRDKNEILTLVDDYLASRFSKVRAEADTRLTDIEGAGYVTSSSLTTTLAGYVKTTTDQNVAGVKTFTDGVAGDNWKITDEGGFAIKLLNDTGVASVKGQLVAASASTAGAFDTCATDSKKVIGVVYTGGIADGEADWIVCFGRAQVLPVNGDTVTMNQLVRVSGVTGGRATSEAAVDEDKAFIGTWLETVAGATPANLAYAFIGHHTFYDKS